MFANVSAREKAPACSLFVCQCVCVALCLSVSLSLSVSLFLRLFSCLGLSVASVLAPTGQVEPCPARPNPTMEPPGLAMVWRDRSSPASQCSHQAAATAIATLPIACRIVHDPPPFVMADDDGDVTRCCPESIDDHRSACIHMTANVPSRSGHRGCRNQAFTPEDFRHPAR